MGNTADDRLNARALAKKLGDAYSSARLGILDDEAAELSLTEQMSHADALKIVSGQTRPPYGTPRIR